MDGDEDVQKRALEEAFGESSDSGDETHFSSDAFLQRQGNKLLAWEMVEGINGLWLCRDFLSEKHQSSLLSAIEREGWFTDNSHNQAMRFGDLPEWATELARFVREAACFGEISSGGGRELTDQDLDTEEPSPLPFDLLWREPFFDQLIVNVYKPGNMCPCGLDAFRGWNRHHLHGIFMCDAFHSVQTGGQYC